MTDTLDHDTRDTLYVTDAELIRRMGVQAVSPEVFAKQMGWAPKRLRRLAKRLGACRVLGNRMALMPEDVQTILEATKPCPSKSIGVKEALSGNIGERLPEIDSVALLAHLTKKPQRE